MASNENELFSEKVPAGRRTYYINVNKAKDGGKYLVIAESQAAGGNYKRGSVMVFSEHLPTFIKGLKNALGVMKNV